MTQPLYKLSPGGNITLLVRDATLATGPDTPRAAEARAALAVELMRQHPDVEQVGFLDTTGCAPNNGTLPLMVMMGGEFCVNACRSAAFIIALAGLLPEDGPRRGASWQGHIRTSGLASPLPVRVRKEHTDAGEIYSAGVAVSTAGNAPIRQCAPGEAVVALPGITHILLDSRKHSIPADAVAFAAAKRAEHGLEREDAVGVVWYAPLEEAPGYAISPLVWVRATGSTVPETACGSGSLALALYLAGNGNVLPVRQPSGEYITIHQNAGNLVWIDGPVRLLSLRTTA